MSMKTTPENISVLKPNEVFVFGSNTLGNHYGGAAALAHHVFDAKWGVGEGLTGRCYALPTLDEKHNKVKPSALLDSFVKFFQTAQQYPEWTFYLTKVGCGIAGWKEREVATIMESALFLLELKDIPENVAIPKEFQYAAIAVVDSEATMPLHRVRSLPSTLGEEKVNALRDAEENMREVLDRYFS